jgi:outer membrane protein
MLCAGMLMLSSVHAQGQSGSQWGTGAIVSYELTPYRNFDNKAEAQPFLLFENRWVRLVGPTLDLKLRSADTVSLGLRLRYSGEGYEADDSRYLQGMAERKASFWVGGIASWRTDWATLSAEVLRDASVESKATRMTFGVDWMFSSGSFEFTPRIAAHYLDDKYVDYYYGVRANEATVVRPFHVGKSTTNVEAGLRISYALAPKHRLSLDLSTTSLGTGIKDSPLVDKPRQAGISAGYLYLF